MWSSKFWSHNICAYERLFKCLSSIFILYLDALSYMLSQVLYKHKIQNIMDFLNCGREFIIIIVLLVFIILVSFILHKLNRALDISLNYLKVTKKNFSKRDLTAPDYSLLNE